MVTTHTHVKLKGHSVEILGCKQKDGQMDRQTEATALLPMLKRPGKTAYGCACNIIIIIIIINRHFKNAQLTITRHKGVCIYKLCVTQTEASNCSFP